MVAANPRDGYMVELEKMVVDGIAYCNELDKRCNPACTCKDCSSFIAAGLNRSGTPVNPCSTSWSFKAQCQQATRPQWMIDLYGPGIGTEITMGQALVLYGAWGIHSFGDGHIKTSMGDGHRSIEAMGHRAGVGYSDFDSPPGFIDYCAIPPMLLQWFEPPAQEEDVITIQCNNKPASPDGLDQPYAVFVPPGALFPIGACICHNGARINNDLPVAGGESIFVPTLRPGGGGTKWVSMMLKPSGKGITFVDDKGNTSGTNAGNWT